MALARGRPDPLQGRGVGLDAERRAAPAGVGRSAGAAPGLRRAGAARPDPPPARRRCRPSASSSARRTRPRSGCTRRSGWSTCSTTGACSSETPAARRHGARTLERRRPRQLASRRERGSPSRGRRRPWRWRGARARTRSISASRPRSCGRRRRSARPRRAGTCSASSSRRSTRSASARTRAGRWRTIAPGPGRTSPTRRAPAAARAGWRRPCGSRTRSTLLLARARGRRRRRVPRAADPLRPRRLGRAASRRRGSSPCRTRRPTRWMPRPSSGRRILRAWARCAALRRPAGRRTTRRAHFAQAVDVLERIEAHIRAHGLVPRGGEVTCLVSGGADSTCLWHALGALGYRVRAVHVHHGLRGDEADADAAHCATAFGAEVVHAPSGRRRRRSCATLRYALTEGRGLRATGHTASDQVETVLYRIVSSGSTRGIRARRGRRRRPAPPAALA